MSNKTSNRQATVETEFDNLEVASEDVEEVAEVAEVRTSVPKVSVATTSKTTRIVLDIPTVCLEKFKLLCHLVGETQSSLVTKAMTDYINDRRELLQQFVELRAKISK